jgi:hypothetical protein
LDSRHGEALRLKGQTAERVVHELAERSFFVDWCFRNPCRVDGKELCDLLVVFDDSIIIAQVKALKLDASGRYNSSEVQKNLKQVMGARRYMLELERPVELENARRKKETFDASVIRKVHLLSIILGPGEESSSFAEIVDGHVVHMVSGDFLEVVLDELDTVADFVRYMTAKEELVHSGNQVTVVGGESELLAYYLVKNKSLLELAEPGAVLVEPGQWEDFQARPEYQAKKRADRISYGWDEIIDWVHTASDRYELVARELARPDRFHRRALAQSYYDAHVQAHEGDPSKEYRNVVSLNGTAYCLLFIDDSVSRDIRRAALYGVSHVARGLLRDCTEVVGIATQRAIEPECSYDFVLMKNETWTEEDQQLFDHLHKEKGVLANATIRRLHDEEYPKAE